MCLGWKKHPWRVETMAEYNKPSEAVKKKEGRRIELGSVGRHECEASVSGVRV